MVVLILGRAKDMHVRHVYHSLSSMGKPVEILDTSQYPTEIQISWMPDQQTGFIHLPGQNSISIQDIHSVYWRSFIPGQPGAIKDSYQKKLAQRDTESMLRTFLQLPHIRFVNGWDAYQFHREKPLQLHCVHQLGVRIPETLVGNDATAIQGFFKCHERVIFKPLYGGAHSQFLTAEHLLPERLRQVLALSPVTLQRYIPGTNVRVYVIGNDIFAAEIRSGSVDFRDDVDHELIAIAVPSEIEAQSRAIASALHLKWTAIDWRVEPSGEYVFLEANPSPMFIKFEQVTQWPITEALVNLLI